MPKKKRKWSSPKLQLGATHVTRLKPPNRSEPEPVDPEKLPKDAVDRRDRYRAQVAAREAAEAAFVPLNQRRAKRDAHGRLIAQDWRDRDPSWLRRR